VADIQAAADTRVAGIPEAGDTAAEAGARSELVGLARENVRAVIINGTI
jgi:hypothetical protein